MWIERALEGHLFEARPEDAQDEEEVRVRGARGDEQLGRDGSGDLGLGGEGRAEKRDAVAEGVVSDLSLLAGRFC